MMVLIMLSFVLLVVWDAPVLPITTAFQSTPLLFQARPSLLTPHTTQQPHGRKDVPIHLSFASVTNNSTGGIIPHWDPIPIAPTPSIFATARRLTPVAFGLVKAMAGTGMLALPLGLAVITDHPKGLWPANVLMSVLGLLSAYTFALYGRLVHATQATSLGGVWKAIMCKNSKSGAEPHRDTSWIVSLANFVYCFGCGLAYSLVLGDILSSLARSSSLRLPAVLLTRQAAILGVTGCVLLPLSNLQSLAALAPVSIVGVLGTLFTTGFLGWRCPTVMASSPYVGCGSFGTYSRFGSIAPLMLVAMSCVAMMAHFSAPEFYHELKKTNGKKNSSSPAATAAPIPAATTEADTTVLRNFFQITTAGFGTIAIVNALTLAFGFLTFGGACQGNILSNFSVSDPGATLCRLLIGVSVMGGFPMCIQPCRSAALEVLKIPGTVKNNRRALGVLVGVLTSIALTVKDVGFVISMNGAVMGSNLMYTIPSLLFLKHTKNRTGARIRWERRFCRLLIGFGGVAMVAGAWVSILSAFYPHLL